MALPELLSEYSFPWLYGFFHHGLVDFYRLFNNIFMVILELVLLIHHCLRIDMRLDISWSKERILAELWCFKQWRWCQQFIELDQVLYPIKLLYLRNVKLGWFTHSSWVCPLLVKDLKRLLIVILVFLFFDSWLAALHALTTLALTKW